MNKFIKFYSILFSSAIFLLNPVFGMEQTTKPFTWKTAPDLDKHKLSELTQKLHLAAERGKEYELNTIIKKLKNLHCLTYCINKQLGWKKQTALMAAIETQYLKKEWVPKYTKNGLKYSIKHIKTPTSKKHEKYRIENLRKFRIIELLIKNGAKIFKYENGTFEPIEDANGNTCLHLAVKDENLDVINCILAASIQKDKDLAKKNKTRKIYTLTLKLLKAKNKDGKTALDLAEGSINIEEQSHLTILTKIRDGLAAFLENTSDKRNWSWLDIVYDYLIPENQR